MLAVTFYAEELNVNCWALLLMWGTCTDLAHREHFVWTSFPYVFFLFPTLWKQNLKCKSQCLGGQPGFKMTEPLSLSLYWGRFSILGFELVVTRIPYNGIHCTKIPLQVLKIRYGAYKRWLERVAPVHCSIRSSSFKLDKHFELRHVFLTISVEASTTATISVTSYRKGRDIDSLDSTLREHFNPINIAYKQLR